MTNEEARSPASFSTAIPLLPTARSSHDLDRRVLGAAQRVGGLDDELERLGRLPLLIVDEVDYIPFYPEAAALFFALISSRYERKSLVLSSNKTFSAWAKIFGDRSRLRR